MGITNEKTTTQMSQLFEQIRQYLSLQKKILSLQSVEILTQLFSAIALTAIFILVGFLVVLFGSFALAYWIGELLNSHILGFAIIAGVLLLCTILIWMNRTSWIVLPTTRFMIKLLSAHVVYPTQEGIAMEKEILNKQLDENQNDIKETTSNIFAPQAEARNRWESASNLLQNGMTIFRGVQIGLSAITAARRLFGGKGKRRR